MSDEPIQAKVAVVGLVWQPITVELFPGGDRGLKVCWSEFILKGMVVWCALLVPQAGYALLSPSSFPLLSPGTENLSSCK